MALPMEFGTENQDAGACRPPLCWGWGSSTQGLNDLTGDKPTACKEARR